MARVEITYRPNPAYVEGEHHLPRLFAAIDLERFGIRERISALPIFFRQLNRPVGPIRQVYSTRIAGLFLEKGNLSSLEKTLDLYLGALIHYGRLPDYFFQIGDRAWPIYRLSDQLVTKYPGNPVLGGATIGELRIGLADYFKAMGDIQLRKELGILYLSRADLQLYPAICALRGPQIADVPVFPVQSGRGTTLLAPVNALSIAVSVDDHFGILQLHRAVSAYLMQAGKLQDPSELTVRKMPAPIWDRLKGTLIPHSSLLAYHDLVDGRLVKREVSVFANDQVLIAGRTSHLGRTALHIATDIHRLQEGLGRELAGEGKLSSPDYVIVVKAKRPEQSWLANLDRARRAPLLAA